MAVTMTNDVGYNENSPVGKYFKLKDIIATSYNVYNFPSTSHWATIQTLGKVLDTIYEKVGPFRVISGYRSAALQNALRGDTQAAAKGTSFHELGLAVDLVPLTKSLNDFYGLIIGQDDVKNICGEIAIKPSQNSIHLSGATSSKRGVAMIMGPSDYVYRSLTPEQFFQYVKYPASIWPVALVGTGVLAYWFLKIRPSIMSGLSRANTVGA